MIYGIGTDFINSNRLDAALKRFGQHFEERIFTPHEQQEALKRHSKTLFYAKRWAAKEAFSKAMGVGIGRRLSWHDIEIRSQESGRPVLHLSSHFLSSTAQQLLPPHESLRCFLSLSDEVPYAQAFVVISII